MGFEPFTSWLLYGDRLAAAVPALVEVTPLPGADEPLELRLEMTLDVVDGRLECIRLVAEGREGVEAVTEENLRRIPVASYVATAALRLDLLREVEPNPAGGAGEVVLRPYAPPPPDFASHGMTDEALEQVSRVYAWAQASGQRATGVLVTDFGMPRPTASRWLAAARQRGILREEHRFTGQRDQRELTEEESLAELEEISQQMLPTRREDDV